MSDVRADNIELSTPDPRPFVKWAGGKGSLVGEIAQRVSRSREYRRYVEPFIGAGAMYFWIRRSFPSQPSLINDSNEELINAYRMIRDRVEEVLAKLETHAHLHSEAHYYRVRRIVPPSPAERAARFIYLNRTCYNGLYRVNRRGEFNVPMGRYANPKIADRENLLAVASALESTEIRCADFGEITEECGSGDLVYLDPPYHSLSETSQFTSYTRSGFDRSQQERLAEAFFAMASRGAAVILSNSDTELIRDLYTGGTPRPVIDRVGVRRSINSKPESRGRIKELLIYHRG